jgi:uncharacterized protein
MKKVIFAILIISGLALNAQTNVPYIEVTGSAEMSVIPDEIELEIVLGSQSSMKQLSIEELDKKFFDALMDHGIPESAAKFVSVDNPFYWYYWWWEYRYYTNTKTYKLKLDCTKYDFSFINDIKPEYIRSIRITSSTHSKITEYRRQVKVEAMLAAKDKANDLLECIGQKIGKVIEVIEVPETVNQNYWYGYYNMQNLTSNCMVPQSSGESSAAGESYVPAIKLRYEIKARFEII